MIPEATLAFVRHPMVTRSTAWLSRHPTTHLIVSRRSTASNNAKSYARDFRFSTTTDPLDPPQGLLSGKSTGRHLRSRLENDLIGIHALDACYYGLGIKTGPDHEYKLPQANYTMPILDRVERQIKDIQRAQSLPNPKTDGIPEYVERPIRLLDTITDGVKPIHSNATIIRLGETFANVVRSTYTNIRGLNQAFQTVTVGLRGGIQLYHTLSRDSWKAGVTTFQPRWIPFRPLVDEPGTVEPSTIGGDTTIAEITSILGRHCCKNLSRLLPMRSCSSHPISTGGFGDIYSGKLDNGTPVAIKVARYSTGIPHFRKQAKHTAKELHTWAKCRHPNVLPLLGMVEFRDQIAMVSPWMKNGDLRSYLRQHPEADRCQLGYDICEGLVYLHSVNIVHGDLKGANVLISDGGKAMLSDFGSSLIEDKSVKFTATTRDAAFSSRWAAPEILEGAAASYPADIFALGMTLLEAITGDVPYRELEREQAVMVAILFKKAIPARPTAYIPHNSIHGDLLWELLTRCWAYDPSDRPHAKHVQSLIAQITKTGLMERPQ